MDTVTEQELKLTPEADDESVLDRLAALDRLGPFRVTRCHTEQQRNGFFDTASRSLRGARLGFRRREVDGERLAAWTLKGEARWLKGVASRSEIEVRLDPDTPPAMALALLGQAARERGAAALAEQLGDALAGSPPPLARPFLELLTERQACDLVAEEQGWEAELALDRVRLVGHSQYQQAEIEVELRRGGAEALEAARAAIEAVGRVRDSTGSKLGLALAHAARCSGC